MNPTTPTRRLVLAVTLALALLAAAGCGASGSDDEAADATTTVPADDTETDDPGTDDTTTVPETTDTEPERETTTTVAGGTDAGRQAYVDALAGDFEDEDLELFGRAAVDCIADRWVEVIGMDRIRASGLSPEEFGDLDADEFPPEFEMDERRANQLYDQFAVCDIDLAATFREFFIDEAEISPQEAACVSDRLDDDALRAALVAEFTGESDSDDFFELIFGCYES